MIKKRQTQKWSHCDPQARLEILSISEPSDPELVTFLLKKTALNSDF